MKMNIPHHTSRILIPVLVFALVSLGCGLPNPINLLRKSATPTVRTATRVLTATRPAAGMSTATSPAAGAATATRPATGDRTATRPPLSVPPAGANLGEEKQFSEGGFSYRMIPNYTVNIRKPADLTLTAPNADGDLGPSFTFSSALVKNGTTNEQLMQEYRSILKDFKFGDSKPVRVGGFQGFAADLSAERMGKEMKGRIAVAMLTSSMRFVLLAGAPKDIWEKETAALFEAELAALKFTGPNPPLPTPKP